MFKSLSLVITNAWRQWTVRQPLERRCHSVKRDQPQRTQKLHPDKKGLVRQCQQLCTDHNVKLIFCSDAGSRSWNYHSDDSDYDLKGFYLANTETYFQSVIDPRVKGDVLKHVHGNVDIELWDVQKAMSHYFKKANQVPLFWFQSDLVYYETPASEMLKEFLFTKNDTIRFAIVHHYIQLASSNFRRFEKEHDLKRYVNVWRGIMCSLWTMAYEEIAPADMEILLADERATEMIPVAHVSNALRLRREGVKQFECDAATRQLLVDKIAFIEKYCNRQDRSFAFDAEWRSIVTELLLTQRSELFTEIGSGG